jgi:hypothetical protein
MGHICVRTTVSFRLPDDDALYVKFVETHDLSEWEERNFGPFLTYSKEEHMILEDINKF